MVSVAAIQICCGSTKADTDIKKEMCLCSNKYLYKLMVGRIWQWASLLTPALDPCVMNLGQDSMYHLTSIDSYFNRETMVTFWFLWYQCHLRSYIL